MEARSLERSAPVRPAPAPTMEGVSWEPADPGPPGLASFASVVNSTFGGVLLPVRPLAGR